MWFYILSSLPIQCFYEKWSITNWLLFSSLANQNRTWVFAFVGDSFLTFTKQQQLGTCMDGTHYVARTQRNLLEKEKHPSFSSLIWLCFYISARRRVFPFCGSSVLQHAWEKSSKNHWQRRPTFLYLFLWCNLIFASEGYSFFYPPAPL